MSRLHTKLYYMTCSQVSKAAMKYFDNLYADLGDSKLSLLTAWEVVRRLTPLTIPELSFFFNKGTVELWCRNAVLEAMEVPLMAWYLYKHAPPSVVRLGKKLVKNVQVALREQIERTLWTEMNAKFMSVMKIGLLDVYVGYPKNFETVKNLDMVYRDYPDVGDSFLVPWLSAMQLTISGLLGNASTFRLAFAGVSAISNGDRAPVAS